LTINFIQPSLTTDSKSLYIEVAMHITLTPELEGRIKNKVESGRYNNASDVIREALRFMDEHTLLVKQMKLDYLRREVAKGAEQAERGEFSEHTVDTLLEELNTQEQTA